jgi:hypothetical protein
MPSHKRRTYRKRHTRHAKKTRKTQKSQKRGGMNRVPRMHRPRGPRLVGHHHGYNWLPAWALDLPNDVPVRQNNDLIPVIPPRPNNVDNLEIIEIEPINAINAVTFEDIHFDQPVLVLDNEHRFQRVYQSNDSIADLHRTMRNPHTRNPIRSAVWMRPVRRNPQ